MEIAGAFVLDRGIDRPPGRIDVEAADFVIEFEFHEGFPVPIERIKIDDRVLRTFAGKIKPSVRGPEHSSPVNAVEVGGARFAIYRVGYRGVVYELFPEARIEAVGAMHPGEAFAAVHIIDLEQVGVPIEHGHAVIRGIDRHMGVKRLAVTVFAHPRMLGIGAELGQALLFGIVHPERRIADGP